MVGKPPLISMVVQWFLVSKTIGSNGFPMVFGPKNIGSNVFSNGFWSKNHWYQWFFNGFVVWQPLDTMVFQWFPMVAYHWSDDGMVTIHCSGLVDCQGDCGRRTSNCSASCWRTPVSVVGSPMLHYAQIWLLATDELSLSGGADCHLVGYWAVENLRECNRSFHPSGQHKLSMELCSADSGDGKR